MKRETFTPKISPASLYSPKEYQRLLRKNLLPMTLCKADLISLAVAREVREAEQLIDNVL